MALLSKDLLEQSPVVANNRMNRERNAEGVNSYERDVSLSPGKFLTDLSLREDNISWLDICCGQGKALIQTALYLKDRFPKHRYNFVGIDLVDMHDPIAEDCHSVSITTGSFFDFDTDRRFDLITCVHGLHYLGDKLDAIRKACSLLKPSGLFIANFDVNSVKGVETRHFGRSVKAWLATNQLDYNSRLHLLRVNGNKTITINFEYLGADDKAGPNYTGQDAVTSYYR